MHHPWLPGLQGTAPAETSMRYWHVLGLGPLTAEKWIPRALSPHSQAPQSPAERELLSILSGRIARRQLCRAWPLEGRWESERPSVPLVPRAQAPQGWGLMRPAPGLSVACRSWHIPPAPAVCRCLPAGLSQRGPSLQAETARVFHRLGPCSSLGNFGKNFPLLSNCISCN